MAASYTIRRRAKQDLSEIVDYLSARSPDAALRLIDATDQEFKLLARHPGAGSLRESPPPRLTGLRSWPVKGFMNYLIFYLPADDGVEIVRVLHGARDVDKIIDAL